MGSLLDELKRRRVFRAVFAWGIFSFAALQATEPLMHALGLPEWTLKLVVAALGLGFPITILLSWTFDLRSTGVERTGQAEPSPGAPSKARLALALAGLGLLVAAPGAAYLYFRSSPGADPAKASAGPPSIAVLPFADMSPGKDQEYLSDGIAEEILSSLSRVEGLRVAGRTSSFYFKGRGARLADIGRELNVGAVLEGGVRRDGDRIRVTATIVNVADGFHAWSQSWDRSLKDILAVENEIAREVVEAMKVRLLGGRRPAVPDPAKTTAEAHVHVLKGREAFRRGSTADWARAIDEYEKALKLDPSLSSAWAGLAMALDYDAEERPTTTISRAEISNLASNPGRSRLGQCGRAAGLPGGPSAPTSNASGTRQDTGSERPICPMAEPRTMGPAHRRRREVSGARPAPTSETVGEFHPCPLVPVPIASRPDAPPARPRSRSRPGAGVRRSRRSRGPLRDDRAPGALGCRRGRPGRPG